MSLDFLFLSKRGEVMLFSDFAPSCIPKSIWKIHKGEKKPVRGYASSFLACQILRARCEG